MASFNVKSTIDKYFQDNWSTTTIQFEGQSLDIAKMISLQYAPVENVAYGYDGSSTGRIEYAGIYKVFCYDTNPVKVMQLADLVKTFLNGKELDNIKIDIGQDGSANDLENGYYECLVRFSVSEWS